MTTKDDDAARVADAQYAAPLATAPTAGAGADHSPLPWRTVTWASGEHFIVDGFGYNVLNHVTDVIANARFIVTACNAHHDLIAAIAYALDEDREWHDVRDVLRKALAKAEGREE